jgi:hypothetical protein
MGEVDTCSGKNSFDIKRTLQEKLGNAATRPGVTFQPDRHLSYRAEPQVLTMNDIGLSESEGISPVAISEPFALFTEEAINVMRAEVFTEEVWEHCFHNTDAFGTQLRGHCPK